MKIDNNTSRSSLLHPNNIDRYIIPPKISLQPSVADKIGKNFVYIRPQYKKNKPYVSVPTPARYYLFTIPHTIYL